MDKNCYLDLFCLGFVSKKYLNGNGLVIKLEKRYYSRNFLRFLEKLDYPVFKAIVYNGYHELLKTYTYGNLKYAAKYNKLETLRFLVKKLRNKNFCYVSNGKFRIIKTLDCSIEVLNYAVKNGNLEMVKCLIKNGCSCDYACNIVKNAIKGGSVPCVSYLFKKGITVGNIECFTMAAFYRQLHCLRYFMEKIDKIPPEIYAMVIIKNYLDVFELLLTKSIPEDIYRLVIRERNTEFLLFLLENGVPYKETEAYYVKILMENKEKLLKS